MQYSIGDSKAKRVLPLWIINNFQLFLNRVSFWESVWLMETTFFYSTKIWRFIEQLSSQLKNSLRKWLKIYFICFHSKIDVCNMMSVLLRERWQKLLFYRILFLFVQWEDGRIHKSKTEMKMTLIYYQYKKWKAW